MAESDVCHDSLALTVLAGPDAASFLQGYLTSDTADLDANTATPTALTNLKGRVIANGWAFGGTSRVSLVVHESTVELIHEHLAKYLMFAKSRFETDARPVTIRADAPDRLATLAPWNWALVAAQLGDAEDSLNSQLVGSHFALVTSATSGRFLPQMLGLTEFEAVSFAKGCYLGQEIVARAQHRGEVKRHIASFAWSGDRPLPGADLTDAGKRAGTVILCDQQGCLAVTNDDFDTLQGEGFELRPM